MSAPTLQPLEGSAPLGTPAAEWAQQTVQAIDPNANITGLVTDAHGNPTTDHSASAIDGQPGHGVNSDKTQDQLEAIKANAPKATDPIPLAKPEPATQVGNGAAHPSTEKPSALFTDLHGNPTSDPSASALEGAPGIPPTPGYAANSTATTPGAQLPGGWIRGPESRQNSMAAPQTSLYEDVSSALDTIGHAAFAAIPASVIGNLSNNPPTQSPAPELKTVPENGAAKPENGVANVDEPSKEQTPPSPPARTASPGFLSRAQGMLSGFLARPASPAARLPAPDAPTTTGEAALVGGGAVAATVNEVGDKIASGQELGGHDPKGVLADEPNLLSEGTAPRTGLPEGTNTAAKFLDPNVATPDPSKPPHDPGLSGSVFPVLADDPAKGKSKATQPISPSQPSASTTSPNADLQAAVNQPIPGSSPLVSPGAKSGETSEADRPQPTVTKVSGSGVMGQILNVRDTVVAPFQGSRAPNSDGPQPDPKTPELGSGVAHVDQPNKTSGNAEAIRTTENPHTAHTELAPVRESGVSVGGTGVADPKTYTGGSDGKNLDGTTPAVGNGTTGSGVSPEANGTANLTHIPGVSLQGNGEGKIIAHEDGGIKSAEVAQAEKEKEKEKEKSGGGGVSRLWSRSRTSVDAAGRRGSVDEANKSPTGTTRRSKSRFNEEGAPTGSESGSTPASPASSRFKVPLKDKIKGEIKIISGKMSKNEAKIEQGIALKTGHASEGAVSPK